MFGPGTLSRAPTAALPPTVARGRRRPSGPSHPQMRRGAAVRRRPRRMVGHVHVPTVLDSRREGDTDGREAFRRLLHDFAREVDDPPPPVGMKGRGDRDDVHQRPPPREDPPKPPRGLRPPPPPPEAFSTLSWRPSSSLPLNCVIACSASSAVALSTKPKPRGRPVSRSVTTAADSTSPAAAETSRSLSVAVLHDRPPMDRCGAMG